MHIGTSFFGQRIRGFNYKIKAIDIVRFTQFGYRIQQLVEKINKVLLSVLTYV